MDGIAPDCQSERGCPIPELGPAGAKVLHLRGLLMRLHGLVDAGTICRMVDAGLEDLELLAVVEDELREKRPAGEP